MNRLLIIDGSNLLFQMFFGMSARIVNEQGKAIQASLFPMLMKFILRQKRKGLLQFSDIRTAAKHSWAGLKKQFERKYSG